MTTAVKFVLLITARSQGLGAIVSEHYTTKHIALVARGLNHMSSLTTIDSFSAPPPPPLFPRTRIQYDSRSIQPSKNSVHVLIEARPERVNRMEEEKDAQKG